MRPLRQDLGPGSRPTLPVASYRVPVRRNDEMTDQAALRQLAYDLVLFAAADDERGLRGVLWALSELSDIDRATTWARADGVGGRALRELADIWHTTPAEALIRLTTT
jgi:hypothetical protein